MTTLLNLKHYFDGGAVDLDPQKPSDEFTKLFNTVFSNPSTPGLPVDVNAAKEQLEMLEDLVDGDEVLDPHFFDYQEPSTDIHFDLPNHTIPLQPGDDE